MALDKRDIATGWHAPSPPRLQKTPGSRETSGGRPVLILWTDKRIDITTAQLDSLGRVGRLYVLAREKEKIAALSYALKPVATLKDFLAALEGSLLLASLGQTSPILKALRVNGYSFFSSPGTYPLWIGGEPSMAWRDSLSILILTGTTAITCSAGMMIDRFGPHWFIDSIRPLLRGADWVHISNEVSFLDTCVYRVGLRFCSKPAHAQAIMESLRVNIVELTGNHNLDFGEQPYRRTLQWYRQRGIHTFGGGLSMEEAYAPLIFTLKDGSRSPS